MAEINEKPAIRFAGFNDPWEQRKFCMTFTSIANNTLSRAELNSNYGTVKNVHYGDVLIKFGECLDVEKEELPYITDSVYSDKFKFSKLQDGDVIIADTAEDETAGKCAEILNIGDQIVVSGLHTIPSRPMISFASGYLGYYMNSKSFHSQLLRLMQGTKVTSISKTALQDTVISYPENIDEQYQISQLFHHLDNLITLHQRKYDKMKNMKKACLEKMFPKDGDNTPELRFVGFTDAWEQRKLGCYLDVSNEKNKENVYSKQDVLSVSGEYGIVNQIEFQGRSFAGVSVSNYGLVCTGDIVYTKSPLNSNPYGIIKTNKGITGIVSTLYAVYHTKKNTFPEFVQVYFEQHARMNNYMHPLVNKGAKNDMKVSAENALKGKVIFPSYEEQKVISEYFNNLDNLITLHQRELNKLQNIKKACLEKMFV